MFKIAAILTLSMPLLLGLNLQASQDNESTGSNATAQVDKDFKALRQKFINLNDSLIALGGIPKDSHRFIKDLREQFASFNAKHPKHKSAIANELQLAIWLDNNKIIDSLFPQLIDLSQEQQPLRTAWAVTQKSKNNYSRAIEILEAVSYDSAKYPRAGVLYSNCLFAENRFQESLDALLAIPNEATINLPALGFEIARIISEREGSIELWAEEEIIRAAELEADNLPRVELITDKGRIVLELFENEAPNTVANFISLIESGFYDLTKFHRVETGSVTQGGDPNTKPDGTGIAGLGGPDYRIHDEFSRDGSRKHFAGSLSMAKNAVPDSGGSQFFLTHRPTINLNGKHTVFGRILEGLDVARSMEVDDLLLTAIVLRKRDHEYTPDTLEKLSSGSSLGLPINISK